MRICISICSWISAVTFLSVAGLAVNQTICKTAKIGEEHLVNQDQTCIHFKNLLAGIILGTVTMLTAVVCAIFCCIFERNRNNMEFNDRSENPLV